MSSTSHKFLHIVSASQCGSDLYFKSLNKSGTFCLENGKQLRKIHEKNMPFEWNENQYSGCVNLEDKILFVPYCEAQYITVIDVKTKKSTYIKNIGSKKYKIGIPYEGKVYFLGEHLDGDNNAVLNLTTLEFCEVSWTGDAVEQAIAYNNYAISDDIVMFPNFGYGNLSFIDLKQNHSKLIPLKDQSFSPSTVAADNDKIWVTGDKNEIQIYDKKSLDYDSCLMLDDAERRCPWNQRFSASVILGEYIYFAPVNFGKIIRVNRHNLMVEDVAEIGGDNVCWSVFKLDDNHVYFDLYNHTNGEVGNLVVSLEGETIWNDERFMISNLYFKEELLESKTNSLKGYIDYICEEDEQ